MTSVTAWRTAVTVPGVPEASGPPDPFWAGLGDEDRAVLLRAGRARSHPRGGVVFRQGDRSDSVVVVIEGRVKIVAVAEDGSETVLPVRTTLTY